MSAKRRVLKGGPVCRDHHAASNWVQGCFFYGNLTGSTTMTMRYPATWAIEILAMHGDEPSPVDGEIVAGRVPTILSVFRSRPGTQCHLWLFLERQGLKPSHSNRWIKLGISLGEPSGLTMNRSTPLASMCARTMPLYLSVQFLLTTNTTPPLLLIL